MKEELKPKKKKCYDSSSLIVQSSLQPCHPGHRLCSHGCWPMNYTALLLLDGLWPLWHASACAQVPPAETLMHCEQLEWLFLTKCWIFSYHTAPCKMPKKWNWPKFCLLSVDVKHKCECSLSENVHPCKSLSLWSLFCTVIYLRKHYTSTEIYILH